MPTSITPPPKDDETECDKCVGNRIPPRSCLPVLGGRGPVWGGKTDRIRETAQPRRDALILFAEGGYSLGTRGQTAGNIANDIIVIFA